MIICQSKHKWDAIAADPTSLQIALGSTNDNRVKIYDIRNPQKDFVTPNVPMLDNHNLSRIIGLNYSSVGELLVTYPSCIQKFSKGQALERLYGDELSREPVFKTKAHFLGLTNQYIVCGVQGCYCIVWDKIVEESKFDYVKFLKAGSDIMCIMPHPRALALATSGLDGVVKVWEPSLLSAPGDAVDEVHQEELANHYFLLIYVHS